MVVSQAFEGATGSRESLPGHEETKETKETRMSETHILLVKLAEDGSFADAKDKLTNEEFTDLLDTLAPGEYVKRVYTDTRFTRVIQTQGLEENNE